MFHEYIECIADAGRDESGTAKHLQALAMELAFVKATKPEEFSMYLKWRKRIETSNFFKLRSDKVVNALAVQLKNILPYIELKQLSCVDFI